MGRGSGRVCPAPYAVVGLHVPLFDLERVVPGTSPHHSLSHPRPIVSREHTQLKSGLERGFWPQDGGGRVHVSPVAWGPIAAVC